MISIFKSVTVVTSENEIIGSTYPKRARGLAKHGRAVFLDDKTIRLLSLSGQKGTNCMSTKEALLAAINEMSETQMHSLLTFLNTFKNNPVDVTIPAPAAGTVDPVRAGMMNTLQERMNALDYSSPNAENVLKELKDMLNMLLRV